jgi:hypothetical protein
MSDYAISEFEGGQFLLAGSKPRKPSIGRRLASWIETRQQGRADREILRTLRRW